MNPSPIVNHVSPSTNLVSDIERKIVSDRIVSMRKQYKRLLQIISIVFFVLLSSLVALTVTIKTSIAPVIILTVLYLFFAGLFSLFLHTVRPLKSLEKQTKTGELSASTRSLSPRAGPNYSLKIGDTGFTYFGTKNEGDVLASNLITLLQPYNGQQVSVQLLLVNGTLHFPLRFEAGSTVIDVVNDYERLTTRYLDFSGH